MIETNTSESIDQGREIVAYFSMEIGLEEGIPTYAGGLGMLAGDTVRSAAEPTWLWIIATS